MLFILFQHLAKTLQDFNFIWNNMILIYNKKILLKISVCYKILNGSNKIKNKSFAEIYIFRGRSVLYFEYQYFL